MTDVADAARVSEATVDRVLNGRGGVSREKEALVLKWARDLKIDRALAAPSHRWLRVAVLMHHPDGPYYLQLKRGFEVAQQTFGEQRVTCPITYFDSFEPTAIARAIRRVATKCDGLVLCSYEHHEITEAVRQATRDIPVITLASDLPGTGRLAYVGTDNRGAGRAAAELMGRFLAERGGKVIIFTGMHDFLGHNECEDGFRSVLRFRYPRCDVVETVETGERTDVTEHLTLDAFRRYSDLRGIYNISVGDEGISSALLGLGKQRSTVFIGHGLDEASRGRLIDGIQDAVLEQDPMGQAARSIDIILRHYHRNPGKGLPHRFPVTVLMRENLPPRN